MNFSLKTFALFIIIAVFGNTAFSADIKSEENLGNSGTTIEQPKTIKQLKKEVNIIDKQKKESEKQLDNLKKELLVKKFFKVKLSAQEKEKLNLIIKKYKIAKTRIESEIIKKSQNLENTKDLKKELLINEKEFYSNLIEYIDITKYKDYTDYIKKNISIIKQQTELESSKQEKNTIIKNKVDNIKEKIKENNKKTNLEIIAILNTKIDKLLIKLTQKEKFQKLDINGKNKLFDSLIENIKKKLEILEKKENKTNIQKILIENKDKIIENIRIFQNKIINKK